MKRKLAGVMLLILSLYGCANQESPDSVNPPPPENLVEVASWQPTDAFLSEIVTINGSSKLQFAMNLAEFLSTQGNKFGSNQTISRGLDKALELHCKDNCEVWLKTRDHL